jgi:Na+/phosphate symporter
MNTMEITKEDRILLKELEQKFENQETLTETQKEILVDYYETEVMRKEQDLQAIEKEINSYNDKLRKLTLKKESEKVSA